MRCTEPGVRCGATGGARGTDEGEGVWSSKSVAKMWCIDEMYCRIFKKRSTEGGERKGALKEWQYKMC